MLHILRQPVDRLYENEIVSWINASFDMLYAMTKTVPIAFLCRQNFTSHTICLSLHLYNWNWPTPPHSPSKPKTFAFCSSHLWYYFTLPLKTTFCVASAHCVIFFLSLLTLPTNSDALVIQIQSCKALALLSPYPSLQPYFLHHTVNTHHQCLFLSLSSTSSHPYPTTLFQR